MAEALPLLDQHARKVRQAILTAVREVGQGPIAKACGIAPSTCSTYLSENIDRIATILAAARTKVVAVDDLCVDPGEYRFLRKKAIEAMRRDQEDDLAQVAATGDTSRALRFDAPESDVGDAGQGAP